MGSKLRAILQRAERVQLKKAVSNFGLDTLAAEAGITRQTLSAIVHRREVPKPVTRHKLERAIATLNYECELDEVPILCAANAMIAESRITLRGLARQIELDPSNLSKVLAGKRRASRALVQRLKAFLEF